MYRFYSKKIKIQMKTGLNDNSYFKVSVFNSNILVISTLDTLKRIMYRIPFTFNILESSWGLMAANREAYDEHLPSG